MVGIDEVRELIDLAPKIKNNFYAGAGIFNYSGYNFRECRIENLTSTTQMIYKDEEFMEWSEKLLKALSSLKKDELIDDIIKLIKDFKGIGDKARFDKLEKKLTALKANLEDYMILPTEIVINDERISEGKLVEEIIRALSKMQRNHNYGVTSDENTMNDYIRDILDVSYDVNDQTRQGESEEGNDAGEIDIQIRYNKLPVVMVEGLILKYLDKNYLNDHIDKVLTKYDPNGCPYVVVLVYCKAVRFEAFYIKFLEHLKKYEFPFVRNSDIVDVDTRLAELKHSQTTLNRNEQHIRVHFFVAHIV